MTTQRLAARFLGEPLVHFAVLALVIFAFDYIALGQRENPREIVVDAATYEELLDIFKEGQGRQPSESEMGKIVLKWSQNEVLYREAQRLGLDKGDEMIRSRLILKIRNILFSNVVTPVPSEQDLRDWLNANRGRYDRPDLHDVEQVRLDNAVDEAAAREAALRATQGELDAELAGRLRRYAGRPAVALESVFVATDAQALLRAPPRQWVAVRSQAGWHLARITATAPGVQAQYDAIRGKLAQDWQAEMQQRELAQALQAIVGDYDIRLDLDADRVRESLSSQAVASRGLSE